MMKKALIVVDYQKDFVDGALGFERAKLLEDGICEKIKEYQQNNDTVIFTLDTHQNDYLDTKEGRDLPVKHCIENTDGYNLYGKVGKLCDEKSIIFKKVTFGSLELANFLNREQYEKIELIGLVSNICVISNAILAKSALPEAEIIVCRNLIDSFDATLNDKTCDILAGLYIKM